MFVCLNDTTLLEFIESDFYVISLINTSRVELFSMLNFMFMLSCTIMVRS